MQNGIKPSELVTRWNSLDEIPTILKKLHFRKNAIKEFNRVRVMVNL